jgi:putative redox protein
MTDAKPAPLTAELLWTEGVTFGARSGSSAIVVDGDGVAGPSPMQLLAEALAGCMATDVVMIVTKGRHPLKGLRVALTAERAPDPPRRILRIVLSFHLIGEVPAAAVERAIALSTETYCSVWHSLRQDIELTTTYDINP